MSDSEEPMEEEPKEEFTDCKRKVLIPVDGSEHSHRALKFYCDNIHKPGDLLMICHCLEIPPIPPTPFPYGVGYYEDWRKQVEDARDASKSLLVDCKQDCNRSMLGKYTRTHEDHCQLIREERDRPGPSVCKLAKEEKVDLIVIGSRGQSKIRRTILGSVSDYVVHHSRVPVAVVPPQIKTTKCEDKKKEQKVLEQNHPRLEQQKENDQQQPQQQAQQQEQDQLYQQKEQEQQLQEQQEQPQEQQYQQGQQQLGENQLQHQNVNGEEEPPQQVLLLQPEQEQDEPEREPEQQQHSDRQELLNSEL